MNNQVKCHVSKERSSDQLISLFVCRALLKWKQSVQKALLICVGITCKLCIALPWEKNHKILFLQRNIPGENIVSIPMKRRQDWLSFNNFLHNTLPLCWLTILSNEKKSAMIIRMMQTIHWTSKYFEYKRIEIHNLVT